MRNNNTIRVLADQYLVDLHDFVDDRIELQTFDPRTESPADFSDYEALLIRTVTPINRRTIAHFSDQLRFIATGSAGVDHVDESVLREREIAFAHAPGCNARSVAEYVFTGLLIWAERTDHSLKDHSLAIIGMGNVGTAVLELARHFEMECICYDPPRAERDPNFASATLDDVRQADILTLHTPLTDSEESDYPTKHWFSKARMADTRFQMVINAARGGIIDESFLNTALDASDVQSVILDVWENEPQFDCKMAQRALFSTPHIAGYAIESKRRATKMICDSLYDFFDLAPVSSTVETEIERHTDLNDTSLESVLMTVHPLFRYHKALRNLCESPQDRASKFAKLRTDMPLRHEFGYLRVDAELLEQYPALTKLDITSID
jgi:erythronate-4-phosphate dehydrogenase